MDTVADVLVEGRGREAALMDAPDRAAPYSYGEFCANAWKAGNLLRHYGVRPDAGVAVLIGPKEPEADDDPGRLGTAADPLVAVLGGASLGGTVDLTPTEPIDERAVVMPSAWLDRFEVAPGCSRLAWGGPPEDPSVSQFERELWSENPIEPPGRVAPEDPLLRIDGETYSHGELLDTARSVADEWGLDADDTVVLDASLADPGTFAAGVVAPLVVGATILPGTAGDYADRDDVVYVVSPDGSGENVVPPGTLF